MKIFSWKVWLILSLLWLSAFLYLLNYLIFKDINYMARLFLAQLGFLPISILLVTFIVNHLLTQHAKRAKLAKLNMVIGAFFSDVGLSLLNLITRYDLHLDDISKEIVSINRWTDNDFLSNRTRLLNYDCKIVANADTLEALQNLLVDKKDFMMRLIENPSLLEHDSFSDLLLAVFHLSEELAYRRDIRNSPPADLEHLAGDVKRVYILLISEWLAYMKHLREKYPYLFSLALRTNPFDPRASAVIS
jgi:hypothetical protein